MTCLLCGSDSTWAFFQMENVPTQDGRIWETAAEAKSSPVGDIELFFCRNCTYIWNDVHEADKVDFVGYDVSLEHSQSFREFTDNLAMRLIENYGIREKTVVDVGCGKGQFLRKLVTMGANCGVGFDPSYDEPPEGEIPNLEGHRAFFGDSDTAITADLFVCRHVIDVVSDPLTLPRLIREAMRPTSIGYFEVPDALYTFGSNLIWNVVYEHKSWLTREALVYLQQSAGFHVLRVEQCWNDEYLGIDVGPGEPDPIAPAPARVEAIEGVLRTFVDSVNRVVEQWRQQFARLNESGRSLAIWGAGARCITLLNLCDTGKALSRVLDVNPGRQGRFLPRTAQEIFPPESLRDLWPDVLLISNPTYAVEIEANARQLGFDGEVWSL